MERDNSISFFLIKIIESNKMGYSVTNKPAYVFKSMLQTILNSEESLVQVARAINGFLFYSIPQKGCVEISSTSPDKEGEVKYLRAGNGLSIEEIFKIVNDDFNVTVTFCLGNEKIIELQRYQKTRFEITVFEDK